eukprot:4399822-Amphidinium_carterae.1
MADSQRAAALEAEPELGAQKVLWAAHRRRWPKRLELRADWKLSWLCRRRSVLCVWGPQRRLSERTTAHRKRSAGT